MNTIDYVVSTEKGDVNKKDAEIHFCVFQRPFCLRRPESTRKRGCRRMLWKVRGI